MYLTESENAMRFLGMYLELVARKTHNDRNFIVDKIGYDNLKRIYDLHDVYHCLPPDQLVSEAMEEFSIEEGKVNVPDKEDPYWSSVVICNIVKEIGTPESDYFDKFLEIYTSWLGKELLKFDPDYYVLPPYILADFWKEGRIVREKL